MGNLTSGDPGMSVSQVERLREQGYAITRGFLSAEEVAAIRRAVDAVYAEGLKHHAAYRDGNLCFDILNAPKAMKRSESAFRHQPMFNNWRPVM